MEVADSSHWLLRDACLSGSFDLSLCAKLELDETGAEGWLPQPSSFLTSFSKEGGDQKEERRH